MLPANYCVQNALYVCVQAPVMFKL